MTCTSVSTLKGSPQLPMLPSQPPTTSSGWQALRIIIQTILQQIQGAAGATGVNVIPQQYALFGASTLPPITATNCTVALDTSTVLFGVGSLKITITGANATVSFGTGFPMSPNASWLISFFTQASAQVAGSITITTPSNTYTTAFTSPTGSGWQRLYDTLNLVADDSTSFGVSFSFPNASGQTVWIDGSQMEPWSNVPMGPSPFISTSGALTVDNLPDGSTYARTVASDQTSNRIDFSKALLNKQLDNIPDGSTYARTVASDQTSNRIDFSKALLNKELDNIPDGSTYARILGTQLSSGAHKLTIAGSGMQIADQRNAAPILTAGAQTVWQNLSITYTAAAGTPATATISVTAAQILGLVAGGGLVSYNASSASVTGTGGTSPTYFLYYIDPAYSGGTQTLYATTTGNDLRQQLGIVYIGSVVVAFPTSGTGGGSGGGGLCVADDMFVRERLRAGEAKPGDVFDCVDLPTGQHRHQRPMLGVTRGTEECVRIVTDRGAALVCSISTPFDTVDGRMLLAPQMLGEEVLTDDGIERVVSVTPVGRRSVSRIHLGGVSYAAGEDPARRIYSHNTATVKP